jgi:hypothetical protein
MEKSNKRGKIPQADWPLIMTRYEAGETLASIARTYDCSPPAISYVVSKSRARRPAQDKVGENPSERESQLVKGIVNDSTEARLDRRSRHEEQAEPGGADRGAQAAAIGPDTDGASAPPPLGNERDPRISREIGGFVRDSFAECGSQPPRAHAATGAGNSETAPVWPASIGPGQRNTAASPLSRGEADARHKLRLSLGNGAASHNGRPDSVSGPTDRPPADRPIVADSQLAALRVQPPYPTPSRPEAAGFSEAGPGAVPPPPQNVDEARSRATARKDAAASFIDEVFRARVENDIASFLGAFDAAMAEDTQENRLALRDATDRLLRVGARTRIELERLEARVPLTAPSRHGDGPGDWRHR